MRKITIFSVISLMWIVSTTCVLAEGSSGIALTMKVTGKVKLKRDGNTSNLTFGQVLNHGDVVTTGKKGFVTIVFTDDKSMIKLTANTEVTLQGQRDKSGNISKRVSMDIGQIFAKVSKQRGTLQIATPTSVASVKGTEFWIVVDEDGNSFVTTIEGLVELMSRIDGRVVEVRKAQRGEVDADGNITVEDVPEDEIPDDPDPDGVGADGARKVIEVDFADEEGNIRTIRIEILEHEQENEE